MVFHKKIIRRFRKRKKVPLKKFFTPGQQKVIETGAGIGLALIPAGRVFKGARLAKAILPRVGKGLISTGRGIAATVGKSFIQRPLKTTLGVLAAPAALGLASTPFARKVFFGGFKRGRGLPEQVTGIVERFLPEDKPSPVLPFVAGAGVAAAGAAIIPRVARRFKKDDVIGIPPPISTQAFQPLAPVQQPPTVEEIPLVAEVAAQKPVTIKNVFNPSIDISFKKTRRFINQQINV